MFDHPFLRSELLALLKAHQPELQAGGFGSITLFASVVREDAGRGSDTELALRATTSLSDGRFDRFKPLDALHKSLVSSSAEMSTLWRQ